MARPGQVFVAAIMAALLTPWLFVAYVTLTPTVYAQGYDVTLESRQDNGATANVGTITFEGVTHSLPATVFTMHSTVLMAYNPAVGYAFVRWEHSAYVTLSDPNSQSTTATLAGDASLRAIYRRTGSVGGYVIPMNVLSVLAPYLATITSAAWQRPWLQSQS